MISCGSLGSESNTLLHIEKSSKVNEINNILCQIFIHPVYASAAGILHFVLSINGMTSLGSITTF